MLNGCSREAAWHSQEYGTHRNESPRGPPAAGLGGGGAYSPGWVQRVASVLAAVTMAASEHAEQAPLEPAPPSEAALIEAPGSPEKSFPAGAAPDPGAASADDLYHFAAVGLPDAGAAACSGTTWRCHALSSGPAAALLQVSAPELGGNDAQQWRPPRLPGAEAALRRATEAQQEETATLRAALQRRSQVVGMRQNALHRPRSAASGVSRDPPGWRERPAPMVRPGAAFDPAGPPPPLPEVWAAPAFAVPLPGGAAPSPPRAVPSSLFAGGAPFAALSGPEALFPNCHMDRVTPFRGPPPADSSPHRLAEQLAMQQRLLVEVLERLLEQQRGQQQLLERERRGWDRQQAQQLKRLTAALQLALRARGEPASATAGSGCPSPPPRPSYASPTDAWRRRGCSLGRGPLRAGVPDPGNPRCFACSQQPPSGPKKRRSKRSRSQSPLPASCAACWAAHRVPQVVVYRDSPAQTSRHLLDSEESDEEAAFNHRTLFVDSHSTNTAHNEDKPVDLVERCSFLCHTIQDQLSGLQSGLATGSACAPRIAFLAPCASQPSRRRSPLPEEGRHPSNQRESYLYPSLRQLLSNGEENSGSDRSLGPVTPALSSILSDLSGRGGLPPAAAIFAGQASTRPGKDGRATACFDLEDEKGPSATRQAEFRALCRLLDGAQALRHGQQQLLTLLRTTLGLDGAPVVERGGERPPSR